MNGVRAVVGAVTVALISAVAWARIIKKLAEEKSVFNTTFLRVSYCSRWT